jgi:hypothetical protein
VCGQIVRFTSGLKNVLLATALTLDVGYLVLQLLHRVLPVQQVTTPCASARRPGPQPPPPPPSATTHTRPVRRDPQRPSSASRSGDRNEGRSGSAMFEGTQRRHHRRTDGRVVRFAVAFVAITAFYGRFTRGECRAK